MTLIIIVGRLIAVWFVHFMLMACCGRGKVPDVNLRELGFVSYGGMIRGAIAFGLVLKIPANDPENPSSDFRDREIAITTTLSVVIITTVLFGSFMPLVQKILVPPQKSLQETLEEDQSQVLDSAMDKKEGDIDANYRQQSEMLSEVGQPILENTREDQTDSFDKSQSKRKQVASEAGETHYEFLKHPNQELSDNQSRAGDFS